MKFLIAVFLTFFCMHCILAAPFPIGKKGLQLWIVYQQGQTTDSIVSNLLAADIQKVTGQTPAVSTSLDNAKGAAIIIGKFDSKLIQKYTGVGSKLEKNLSGKWESFALKHLPFPGKPLSDVFLVSGSDTRGTAYGAFYISEQIGVSPWYWWADVIPQKRKIISLPIKEYYSKPPSVKYRGIFINDEDWGLQPWAAKTFEPETGNIGPKTYAKVFELLLRLKANLLWPAMHPGTAPFFSLPGNQEMAADYSIVIGSSHAEPMLRNNVGEWNEKTMGSFNYLTNTDRVQQYWKSRVQQSQKNEVIFSMGMRGVHDSGIEGVKSAAEAVPLVERILTDQRNMLQAELGKKATVIPQAFTAYKEVLEIYDKNLKLPEDITLVWPDDNYGYIQRLSNEKERMRSGGAGVYYHASYWGRPHDYLWLSSTNPSLIREEMMKAYSMGADKIWVLNVGDIKPLEYNIQLFMDMAYDVKPFEDPLALMRHSETWNNRSFGLNFGKLVNGLLDEYYSLAFERRPEFMGWSQTEPTTPTRITAYNHEAFGDEASTRIQNYEQLASRARSLRKLVPDSLAAAFYQLLYYPIVCASLMNKKILYLDKAILYKKQNRVSAEDYFRLSTEAYKEIVRETEYFNDSLMNGKWKNIMSMKPRSLPVFDPPQMPAGDTTLVVSKINKGWEIAVEQLTSVSDFPAFYATQPKHYFVDIYLTENKILDWTATASAAWIKLSAVKGSLDSSTGKRAFRLWISHDESYKLKSDSATGIVSISADGQIRKINISLLEETKDFDGKKEINNYISIDPTRFNRNKQSKNANWSIQPGFGMYERSLHSLPLRNFKADSAYAEYDFYLRKNADPKITVYSLPTYPLNSEYGMRYALSIDGGEPVTVDFKTVGRSEEWKQNVLRNSAEKFVKFKNISSGPHKLRLHVIDPGVIINRILITTADIEKSYSEIR